MFHNLIVEYVKEQFRMGMRVRLIKMDDPQAPPVGTMGTVMFVDDAATIHVCWDNGSTLGVAYGADVIAKVITNEDF